MNPIKSELNVTLLHNSPISLVALAVRTCTATEDKMDSNIEYDFLGTWDEKLIRSRILPETAMNPAHSSVLEHITYCFHISGISRALLHELKTHRIASTSTQSSRFTLKKLLKRNTNDDWSADYDLMVLTGNRDVDELSVGQLRAMRRAVIKSDDPIPNDQLKYALPESLRVELMLSINARSLRNLFVLRTSKRALWEIRRLAFTLYDTLPETHKFIFADRLHDRPEHFRPWMYQ